jgi:DinB superfamily
MSIFTNPAGAAREEAQAYTAALLELLGDRDPHTVLAALPDAVEALTVGVDEALARRPEREGKWSIVQVVSHLADTETVYGYRMRMIVAQDAPPIQGYDQDLWGDRLHYRDEPLSVVVGELRMLRGRNLRFTRCLDDTELDRVGVHSERGRESVRHNLRLVAAHDLLHRAQLARIRRAVGLDR